MTRLKGKRLVHIWMLLASAFFALGPSIAAAACCCCSPKAVSVANETDSAETEASAPSISSVCPHCADCRPKATPVREHCPADQGCRCHELPDAVADGKVVRIADLDFQWKSVAGPTVIRLDLFENHETSSGPPDPFRIRTGHDVCVQLCRWRK